MRKGSPPHTRGRCSSTDHTPRPGRFTPAYAGKIRADSLLAEIKKVHPRIRGEDLEVPRGNGKSTGSPPHTRGRFHKNTWLPSKCRFTPAYAGKISGSTCQSCQVWVHPRIRGEDIVKIPNYSTVPGSPPHTRGRLLCADGELSADGFTPAYAGKMDISRCMHFCHWVHPRIRGEDP